MFRLAGYDIRENDTEDRKEFIKYISTVASDMLITAFERTYLSGNDEFLPVYDTYFGDDFFEGLGKIYDIDDEELGMLIVKKKAEHILNMLRDEELYYTFDLLEEYMLYAVTDDSNDLVIQSFDMMKTLVDNDKYTAALDTLKEKYNFAQKEASELADKLTNILLVRLNEDEDENLYFWDRDYEYVFDNGFVEGMKYIKSYAGLSMGYGYDYACEMFNNIDMIPPIEILGTKAASEVENEASEKAVREAFANMEKNFFGGSKSSEESDGKDDSNVIPFRKKGTKNDK